MKSLVLGLALVLAACSPEKQSAQQGEVQKFPIHGQIVELDAKAKLATIKHENIEGFMKAMTMAFPVKDEKEFAALKVGEVIDGTVYKETKSLDYWIADIRPAETK